MTTAEQEVFGPWVVYERATEPRASAPASLEFIVEPSDATVKIAGMAPHVGMPWKVDLDPGVVQIKVSRDGHQSWETSVELSAVNSFQLQ